MKRRRFRAAAFQPAGRAAGFIVPHFALVHFVGSRVWNGGAPPRV